MEVANLRTRVWCYRPPRPQQTVTLFVLVFPSLVVRRRSVPAKGTQEIEPVFLQFSRTTERYASDASFVEDRACFEVFYMLKRMRLFTASLFSLSSLFLPICVVVDVVPMVIKQEIQIPTQTQLVVPVVDDETCPVVLYDSSLLW